jgi:xylulokinase
MEVPSLDTLLVIDVNEKRCRISYVNRDGDVIAGESAEYLTGRIGDWVEQEPRDWWLEFTLALRALQEKSPGVAPAAIALTGNARILLLVGDDDRLDAAMTAEDRRATLEWQGMVERIGLEPLLRSANIVHEDASPLARLLWLKKHQTGMYEQARTVFLGAHDYMAFRLCGARVTDYATASASDLFALQQDSWAIELMASLELRTDWLPELVDGGARVGDLDAAVAEKLGLPAGIPVIHGVADVAAAMTGAGVSKSNQYACYLGESGWLGTTGLNELANPITGLLNLRNPAGANLLVVGPMITAAGNFEWLKDRFGPAEEKAFADANLSLDDLMMTLAAESPAGSNGVIFLPYLSGEQAPYRDPNARAGWFHVHRKTWRSDLYRAVLEGVAFSMRAIQLLIPEPQEGEDDVQLRLIGSETCTPLWAQIFADVFDCKLDLLAPYDDVVARGAAFIAGRSLGWFSGDAPDYAFIRSKGTYVPNGNNVEVYDRMFQVFCKLYPALHSSFQEMANK